MTNLIGISGKKQHGKDAIAKIIQYHTDKHPPNVTLEEFVDGRWWSLSLNKPTWEIKKYAGKLKDIVCLLTGCSRGELENNDFKEEVLGEEWWVYKVKDTTRNSGLKLIPYVNHEGHYDDECLVKMTRRVLMELLGTECGRDIVHPNLWVNSLFADYKGIIEFTGEISEPVYPNWIITDVRFENEVDAIKQRGGIVIRVDRPFKIGDLVQNNKWVGSNPAFVSGTIREVRVGGNSAEYSIEKSDGTFAAEYHDCLELQKEHESEIALDDYKDFDRIIRNFGTLEELEAKVLKILDYYKIPYNK